MTKIDLSIPKPIPGFNPQKWLRKVRRQIYEETKDMTPEQRLERTRQASERLQAEMRCRGDEPEAEDRT